MAAVHHAPAAMHHLRGINALLSAVNVHFRGGIFKTFNQFISIIDFIVYNISIGRNFMALSL